ncbi:MAG: HD domain-containing protein [Bacillota bacterium]
MEAALQLAKIKAYVFSCFTDDPTGHDYYHMERVARMARMIANKEGAEPFICEAAAWLHDIGDEKLFHDSIKSLNEMDAFLHSIDFTKSDIKEIRQIMRNVSFRKGMIPTTMEGKVVQDADRLDAIGAIGIARTFAYGGAKGQPIFHETSKHTSIQHFYDKLLKLKGLLHTETAQEIANERHQFMERYLEQFYNEW